MAKVKQFKNPAIDPEALPVVLKDQPLWNLASTSQTELPPVGHSATGAPPHTRQEVLRFIEIIDRSYLGLQDFGYAILKYFTHYLNAQTARMYLMSTLRGELAIPETHIMYPFDAPPHFPDVQETWPNPQEGLAQTVLTKHLDNGEVLISYPLFYRDTQLCQLDFICHSSVLDLDTQISFLNQVKGELTLRISKEITLERSYLQKRIINQQQRSIVKQQRALNQQILNIIQISKRLSAKFSA